MSFPGGYFASLREKYSDGEISDLISVTSNSTWMTQFSCGGSSVYRTFPIALIQRNAANIFHSKRYEIAVIIIDMKTPFSLKGFALRGTQICCCLKSYSFKGSNDNATWNPIKYNSNIDLNSNDNWHNYTFPKARYRYFGIFPDPDASLSACGSDYYYALSGIDFIKASDNDERGKRTCRIISSFKVHIFIYIFIAKG